MRSNQESESKEHCELAKPRDTVEEIDGAAFVSELAVSEHETSYIYGKEGVSVGKTGDGEDEDTACEDKNRIKTFVLNVDFVHEPDKQFACKESEECTYYELPYNIETQHWVVPLPVRPES